MGTTDVGTCSSDLNGAKYATSIVSMKIKSILDQGFDSVGIQVWELRLDLTSSSVKIKILFRSICREPVRMFSTGSLFTAYCFMAVWAK